MPKKNNKKVITKEDIDDNDDIPDWLKNVHHFEAAVSMEDKSEAKVVTEGKDADDFLAIATELANEYEFDSKPTDWVKEINFFYQFAF